MADQFPIDTFTDIVRHYSWARPDAVALSFYGRITTWAEFDRLTAQAAAAIRGAGITPGDRVSYLGMNTDDYFIALFGAARAGAVMTPVNWRLAAPEVGFILRDSHARVLFVGPGFEDVAAGLARELPDLGLVIGVDAAAGFRDFRDWIAAAPAQPVDHVCQADDVVVQIYTSGTTGNPKGAMLTHRNFLVVPRLSETSELHWLKWEADDVALVAMPVGHVGGTTWGAWVLAAGAEALIRREFVPDEVLTLVTGANLNTFFLVPAALQMVVRLPGARNVDYSRLRKVTYGASPIPAALLKECMDVFQCEFIQFYGMTETAGAISVLAPADHSLDGAPRMRSAGRPLPGNEVVILDAEGAQAPTGEPGEIVVRSPANMAGYWNLPEATAATLTGEGWLRTGDVGFLDGDGYLYIHDRLKDTIISGAENIYPAEVENAIYGHPAVADVAVIGVPSERWGEEVKALVVLHVGHSTTSQDLIAYAAGKIARFKLPKSVAFIDEMPRNASGKILRRKLREPFWKDAARNVN